MVRNLMMILGVSLAVAAFGCSEETKGTGGTGGSTGACTNAADTAAVCDSEFDATVTTCATDAGGQGEDTAACLVTDAGLSANCAGCYGDVTQCVFDNCLGADTGNCGADREGEACEACQAANCTPAFDACKGTVDCGSGTGGTDGGTGGTDGGTGGTDGGSGGNGGGGGNG